MTRYQSDPGQATAYMIGQLEIKKARSYSKKTLGNDFSLRDFHYQVRLLFYLHSLLAVFQRKRERVKQIRKDVCQVHVIDVQQGPRRGQ